jgi:hypothetical protein
LRRCIRECRAINQTGRQRWNGAEGCAPVKRAPRPVAGQLRQFHNRQDSSKVADAP